MMRRRGEATVKEGDDKMDMWMKKKEYGRKPKNMEDYWNDK